MLVWGIFHPKKNQAKTYNDLCRSKSLSIFGVTSVPRCVPCAVLMYVEYCTILEVHYYYYYYYRYLYLCMIWYIQDPARLLKKSWMAQHFCLMKGWIKAPDYDRIIYTGKTGYRIIRRIIKPNYILDYDSKTEAARKTKPSLVTLHFYRIDHIPPKCAPVTQINP